MRSPDDSGSPTVPQPWGMDDFRRIIESRLVPEMWAEVGLYPVRGEIRADVARAMELVTAEIKHFTDFEDLEGWLCLQARRAVDERVVAQVRSADPTLGRCYCRKILAERIEHYYRLYWLNLDAKTRRTHREDAERAMDARLAAYPGKPAFHRWIRRLEHREDAERDNIHCLLDWLDLLARLTVERYVVEEMRRNPDSHLHRLNLIWTARKVAWFRHNPCGEPPDPRASTEELWAILLSEVWKPLREQVRADTNAVLERINKGLPTFKYQSTLDTWRTTIVRNTLRSLDQRGRARQLPTEPLATGTADGREIEETLADDGESLDERMIRDEWVRVHRQVCEFVIEKHPATAEINRRQLEGMKPREVAAELGIDVRTVHQEFSKFRMRVRRLWREIDGDARALGM